MAWTKEWTDPDNAVTASYWEFISINYDHRTGESEIKAGVWISGQAHADGKQPLYVSISRVPAGANPQLASGALQWAIGYLLAQPEFQGATPT